MKPQQQLKISVTMVILAIIMASCRTLETGGKIVDRSRGEVVISSPGNQQTAIPDGRNDTSISTSRENLERIVKEHPRDLLPLLSLAQLQLAQDRFADSEASCRSALLIDIKNAEARKVLAQISIRTGNYDKALIFLTALGGESSTDSSVHNMLGLIALQNGENGQAMGIWKRALNLNPSDISVRMNMGVLYLKYRLITQARAQFERILKVAPAHQDAMLHLAIIDASRGKNAEAVLVYQEILSKDSTNQLALYNLGVAQKNLNLQDDAVVTFKKYIKASPQRSDKTDHAFALIEEINASKSAHGEPASDADIRALAEELFSRQPSNLKSDQSRSAAEPVRTPVAAAVNARASETNVTAGSNPVSKVQSKKTHGEATAKADIPKEVTPSDAEIDLLEKQLTAPSH